MRRLLFLAIPLSALALTATATGGRAVASASCPTVTQGNFTVGTDNPAYPPWFGGTPAKGSKWKIRDPTSGKGLRERGRLRGRQAARLSQGEGRLEVHAVREVLRAREEGVRRRHQRNLVHAGTGEGRRLLELVLRRGAGGRRQQGHEGSLRPLPRGSARVQAGRAARDDELRRDQERHQAVLPAEGLRHERQGGVRTEVEADRRPRRRPADGVLRDRGAGSERQDHRAAADQIGRRAFRDGAPEGQYPSPAA